jgi:hypothetical protein
MSFLKSEVSIKFFVPALDFEKLSVALTDPIVPLLKASLPGFIAIEKLDLHPQRIASENNMKNIFFIIIYLINNQLKACPYNFKQFTHYSALLMHIKSP